MKLKKLTKEELESMSYDDIAYKIFEEEKKKIKLPVLFRKICDREWFLGFKRKI